VSRVIVATGIASLLVLAASLPATAGAETANVPRAAVVRSHQLPSYVLPSSSAVPVAETSHAVDTESVTDAPGEVYYAAPPPTQVPSPTSDPADLIAATATDDGSNLTFTAQTVALNNPVDDPNWYNDTHIGWAIDPSFSGIPEYYAYFQLNPDGSYDGVLAYAASDTPVSCTVTLSFNTTVGYQAVVPIACIPGLTTFQWFAYSLYDTTPRLEDPNGADGFGKPLPDYRDNGGVVFAPPIGPPSTTPVSLPSTTAAGYWLFARDGGVFAFGRAGFYGSEGGTRLNQPIVGGASTPDGQGYWLVAADGGVFSFGGAPFLGSTGALRLVEPIEGIAGTEDGQGYPMVASDGGIFDFGTAGFFGSEGGRPLNQPIVGMSSVG
jgi:hypothetical protein